MKGLLQRLWAFVRDVSGETALERRMASCGCQAPSDAFKQAVAEAYEGNPHRCC